MGALRLQCRIEKRIGRLAPAAGVRQRVRVSLQQFQAAFGLLAVIGRQPVEASGLVEGQALSRLLARPLGIHSGSRELARSDQVIGDRLQVDRTGGFQGSRQAPVPAGQFLRR